jgi:hypothetical protein
MELLIQIITFLIAILGYYYNGITSRRMFGYYLWIVSNTSWLIMSLIGYNYILALMFLMYNVFCIINIKKLRIKNKFKL